MLEGLVVPVVLLGMKGHLEEILLLIIGQGLVVVGETTVFLQITVAVH